MKSFAELYDEYNRSIAHQKEVIGSYRKKLLLESKKSNIKEVKRLNGILYVLYEEKSELEERAAEIGKYISV